MKKKSTIIHVEFHDTDSHFYFGSIAAIFALFTPEDVAVKQKRLYDFNIEPGKPYTNKKVTIRKGPLYRKAGNHVKHF